MKKMRMEVEFPPEITVDILSRLPAESILECKRVCKTWETLIDDPLFLTTYTARQSLSAGDGNGNGNGSEYSGFCIMGYRQPEHGNGSSCAVIHYGEYKPNASEGACFKVTKPINSPYNWFKEDISEPASWNLIGSSNGLICLSLYRLLGLPGFKQPTYTIYVYNPMTKEFVKLGHEPFTSPGRTDGYKAYRAMGFGYHPSTKEYKVIIINCKSCYYSSLTTLPAGHVKVYTLGGSNNSSSKCRWRDKGEIPYKFTTLHKPGVLVNGALHWLTGDHKIICFDLADEEFRTVLAPPGIDLNCMNYALGALGGCLCVYVKCTSVWVLKKYMMNESWTRILISQNDTHLKEEDAVLRSSGCGAFVSHFLSEKKKIVSYVSYDSESGNINIVSNIGCCSNYARLHMVSYTKSFVSLKALGEEDIQHTGGIR